MPSSIRRSKALRSSPSTRVKCAPAHRGRWSRSPSTTSSSRRPWHASPRSGWATRSIPPPKWAHNAPRASLKRSSSYIDVGKQEGAKCLTGGGRAELGGALKNGFYVKPTVFSGHNKMRIFQEEIFGPVLSVTTFKTLEDAIEIGNDTIYGLGAGVWSRNINNAYRVGRGIEAGRVWTNCYHVYPAHAAFGGYKQSGFGRETHKIILDHYQQTKNLLVSYSPNALGFF